jgi:hypothetical protein
MFVTYLKYNKRQLSNSIRQAQSYMAQ